MSSTWSTRDISTATYLVLAGHPCIEVIASPEHSNRAVFVFHDSAELRTDLQSHLLGEGKVPAAGYEIVRSELLTKARDVLREND